MLSLLKRQCAISVSLIRCGEGSGRSSRSGVTLVALLRCWREEKEEGGGGRRACLILLLISQSPVYSKNKDIKEFNSKNLSSYFSALVSYDNQKNIDALKFFKLSNSLISRHDPYLKAYVFSLVMEGQIKQSIKQLKQSSGEKSSDFFEAYLI